MTDQKLTYDVQFNDETDSNNEGFSQTKEYCIDFIKTHNGTNYGYFGDYKGGVVSVVCNETSDDVYSEDVK